ncbi:MAG: DNA-binding protein [Proteobacteria bacterium]|nr:MAG: DNA-binding protein [Pseudomonadota bacterium]
MYVMDASAIIHAWDNYPINYEPFPALWDSMQNLIEQDLIVFSEANFKEISYNSRDCYDWLKEVNPTIIRPSNDIARTLLSIKNNELGITEDNYHAKGVDEGDLFAIATAKSLGFVLVNNEAKQANDPQDKSKVCIGALTALAMSNN